AEAAHRTPHGKRVAAAERNGLLSTTYSLQNRMAISVLNQHIPLLRTECSAAKASRLLWE
ncbi:hypothetical protein ACNA6I_21440, partial [Rossellomorea sp. FS2]|uniref:hypothetical protein n=1 Tax=Rossellomorea sp. FS2 TaxID=3391447 RepID=UPI003A4DFBCE